MDTARETTRPADYDATTDDVALAMKAMRDAGLGWLPEGATAPTLVRLSLAYERAQTEQDAGYMKHAPEAEAMGRGRAEGIREAVAILLGCDDPTAMAVLDGMDTRP